MTKTAQILRKNGRKRAGTEYSSQALKPYVGDMFSTRGEYIDGMLYMSRMKRSYQAMVSSGDQRGKKLDFSFSSPQWGELARTEGRSVLKDGVSDAFAVAVGDVKQAGTGASRRSASNISVVTPSEEDAEQGSTLTSVQRKQQQRCSLTLSNWSFNPENARLMVEENVVEALIRLCKDGDKVTQLNCVTTFMNLSHLGELRRVIVQQGAVKTVAEIVNDMGDKTIRTACAITLCNLCSLQGEEGLLVEDGAVSALSTLINEHEKVSHICRCALFNLTCVSQSYHKIESVLKAFIALTSTRNASSMNGFAGKTEEEYDDITAKALCNLSNLKRIRLRTSTKPSETKGNCENNEIPVRKNESITSPVIQRDEGAREYMETRFFDKLDPEESLAVMTETEERDSEEDSTWADVRSSESEGNQEHEPQEDTSAGSPKGSRNQSDGGRSPEQSHSTSGRRVGASGAFVAPNYTLSPLSRVVVRKTHAVHAARKFKDAATRKLRNNGGDIQKLMMLGSQSSPCLVKATPEHDPQESVRSIDHASIERKAAPLAAVSKPPAQLSSLASSSSTSSLPPTFGAENIINSQAALVAAVSAAGLYGAAPPRAQYYMHDAKQSSTSLNATQQKKKAALNRRKKKDSSVDPDAEWLAAQPKSIHLLPQATTIEEFQSQAKLLGLWS
ncbi:Serine/threonine-protein phosphatase [Phytophthora cinnamomi]|uniref:Serine/threonine-protein phosphatase n=1 Tax=Phytophthora cinnamomi TaxID=4785 RepID=UPI0035597236|nr:Serine/threonine-protein phosphatase [Phytophthora cinnamomi]